MLRHKGIEYTRMDLPNMTHKAILPLMRYRGSTVPVMNARRPPDLGDDADRPRARGAQPDPPLFPATPNEGDEAWADSVLQDGVRQLARWATGKDPEAMASFLAGPHAADARRARRRRCP